MHVALINYQNLINACGIDQTIYSPGGSICLLSSVVHGGIKYVHISDTAFKRQDLILLTCVKAGLPNSFLRKHKKVEVTRQPFGGGVIKAHGSLLLLCVSPDDLLRWRLPAMCEAIQAACGEAHRAGDTGLQPRAL